MRRFLLTGLVWAAVAGAADPVRVAWILSPARAVPGLGRNVLPDVHSVETDGAFLVVRSAGITLHYLGPLQEAPAAHEAPVEFAFRIPSQPEPATGRHARIPAGTIGAFLNGMPIYNQFEALSYNGANLWHYDAVAGRDDGRLTAAGYPRAELTHASAPGLLDGLAAISGRHSPLVGFAFDGYPIYGPWGFDAAGKLRRMRSSYRLRRITRRQQWPDGTRLTPEQYGPDVSANDPLGTFVEDYEYAGGSGDLDEFNGRFAMTPEYPKGTYAYFLTTDDSGRLAFPYLIGPRFYGRFEAADAWMGHPLSAARRLKLEADSKRVEAGKSVRFRLTALNARGEAIREFEYVHEKPIHFLIASADLEEFDHLHPELAAGDSYEVAHTFTRGGHYRMWADYSLPGEPPHVDAFDIDVAGPITWPKRAERAKPIAVAMTAPPVLRAGEDMPISFQFGGSTERLEPYLGAWAHVVVVSRDLESYAHTHPIEKVAQSDVHTHIVSGAPPNDVRVVTGFPKAGTYKLWLQLQLAGEVLTYPFVLHVSGASPIKAQAVPADAIVIRVTQHGYDPPRLTIPANRAVKLAFIRDGSPNCGSEVAFPGLGIRKALPMNSTALVELTPQPAGGEMAFTCGMGMFRGMIVAAGL